MKTVGQVKVTPTASSSFVILKTYMRSLKHTIKCAKLLISKTLPRTHGLARLTALATDRCFNLF